MSLSIGHSSLQQQTLYQRLVQPGNPAPLVGSFSGPADELKIHLTNAVRNLMDRAVESHRQQALKIVNAASGLGGAYADVYPAVRDTAEGFILSWLGQGCDLSQHGFIHSAIPKTIEALRTCPQLMTPAVRRAAEAAFPFCFAANNAQG